MDDVFVIVESVRFREERDPAPRLNGLRWLFGCPLKEPRVYRWLAFDLGRINEDLRVPGPILSYAIPLTGTAETLESMSLPADQIQTLSLQLEKLTSRLEAPEDYRRVAREVRALANQLVLENARAESKGLGVCVVDFAIEAS